MATDLSIYSNFLRPPKTMQEYSAERDAREANQLGLQQARMNMLSAQQAQQDEQALRALYQQPGFDPQSEEGIGQLMRLNPKAGAAAYQARLAAGKMQAETAHLGAQAEREAAAAQKATAEAMGERLKQYRGALDFVDTPQGAARWLKAQFDDPLTASQMAALGSFDDAVTRIPQDPQAFQQWRQQAGMGMEKHIKAMQERAQLAETARHNRASEVNQAAHASAARDQAQATRDAARIQTGYQNESGLRKEFDDLQEVKSYKKAYPAFASIKNAIGRDTKQADINIVYGLAKLYDPDSVVREGEYATVANSQSIPERVKGYARQLIGKGQLTPETRKLIADEAEGRISAYRAEYDKAKNSFTGIATRRGIDPQNIFTEVGSPEAPSSDINSQADAILRKGK